MTKTDTGYTFSTVEEIREWLQSGPSIARPMPEDDSGEAKFLARYTVWLKEIRDDKRIHAIKAYRHLTDCGLREAKGHVHDQPLPVVVGVFGDKKEAENAVKVFGPGCQCEIQKTE